VLLTPSAMCFNRFLKPAGDFELLESFFGIPGDGFNFLFALRALSLASVDPHEDVRETNNEVTAVECCNFSLRWLLHAKHADRFLFVLSHCKGLQIRGDFLLPGSWLLLFLIIWVEKTAKTYVRPHPVLAFLKTS
jgi:hypothetical protein